MSESGPTLETGTGTGTGASPAAKALPLPRLREELRVERAAPLVDGAPCWTLVDATAHRFYQLGQREMQLLGLWKLGSREALTEELASRGAPLAEGELERLLQFLEGNGLIEFESPQAAQRLAARHQAQKATGLKWLLHHYLFFRVPLLRPADFLRRTLPLVSLLWSTPMLILLGLIGLSGFYLVGRQWDTFLGTFAEFLSVKGLVSYLCAAVLVKVVHEFGHAYAATHFGCRVPTMGVAVMMGMPMLYSDTTSSWRLTKRSSRLMIDAAGVIGELSVALLATFLWAFLPDGSVRGAVFVLATSSWVMSLAVNLNPFMRFDGYYLLSDAVGMPNLQPRAFALARWRLRELLLDLGDQPPEVFPTRERRAMIVYAWTVWIYRLVLYTGIALAVYHFFFKALGVALFMVEMGWFIIRPVTTELRHWWQSRHAIRQSQRAWVSMGAVAVLAGLGLLPLDRSLTLPAMLAPVQDAPLYAEVPAHIDEVLSHNGDMVHRGQLLVRMSSPTLVHERELAQTRANLAQARLDRIAGAPKELAQAMVLARELQVHQRTLQSLTEQQARLEVRAPFDGQLVDMDVNLGPGRWIDRRLEIGRIVASERYDVRAYVPETEAWRLDTGRQAQFMADDPALGKVQAKVVELSTMAAETVELIGLSSVFDGPIATREDTSRGLLPVQAQYHVRLQPQNATGTAVLAGLDRPRQIKGSVRLDAQPQSLLSLATAQVLRVLAREADL